MSTTSTLRRFVAAARRGSPALMAVSTGSLLLLATSLALQLFDPRQLGGASVWSKPAKFAASIVVTGPVLAWILGQLGPPTRGLRRAAGIFSATVVIELVLITAQAARGVPSHFNFTTTANAAIFQTMAAAIVVFWGAQGWLTWRAFRHRFADPVTGAGIRMGLLVSTLGAGLAFTMTAGPTAAQRQALAAGQPAMIGAHTVGAPDGGPGLPVTRWSTQGGDLRVPHFLGLHALQTLPIVAAAVARRRGRTAAAARLVTALGLGYAGLVLTTLVQALRGRPLLAPDALTVALGLAVAAACAWLARARPTPRTVRSPSLT